MWTTAAERAINDNTQVLLDWYRYIRKGNDRSGVHTYTTTILVFTDRATCLTWCRCCTELFMVVRVLTTSQYGEYSFDTEE